MKSIRGFDQMQLPPDSNDHPYLLRHGQAFERSLHFIAKLEEIENEVNPEYDATDDKENGNRNDDLKTC